MGFGGLGAWVKEPNTCRRLRDTDSACGSASTESVAQREPWHVRDLRLLSNVLRLAGASEKRN